MSTTTNTGVGSEVVEKAALHLDLDDAADVFLGNWKDDEKSLTDSVEKEEENVPDTEEQEQDGDEADEVVESEESEADPNEDEEETEDEDDGETEGDEDEGSEEETESKSKVLDDDAVVEVKVDDETLKVSVKDLKRLYGQEAALTKKSQQVAAKRKEVEQDGLKTAAILDKMYQKAAERWKPYSEIDMLVASKQLDTDQFEALRAEAKAAWEDFQFITQEADAFVKNSQAQQQAQLREAAAESVKVLQKAIPNWSNQLYDQIREYGISQGLPADMVNNLVDPVAIQMMHKARLFDESKKIATKKKVAQPKKVIKSTTVSDPKALSPKKDDAAKRLMSSGSTDDAADLFLSRWSDDN